MALYIEKNVPETVVWYSENKKNKEAKIQMSNISFDLGTETWTKYPLCSLLYSFWLLNGI